MRGSNFAKIVLEGKSTYLSLAGAGLVKLSALSSLQAWEDKSWVTSDSVRGADMINWSR